MAVLLALVTALAYGSADFMGGLSSKQMRTLHVVTITNGVGLVGMVIAAPLLADSFDAGDFWIGGIAGLSGLGGIVFLYQGLARGPMAVVAPLTAITAAAFPALYGVIAKGEDLSPVAIVGVVLGLLAIGLVSMTRDEGSVPVTSRVIAQSLIAGIGFGGLFILFDVTADESAPWPVVGSRVVQVTLLVAILAVVRQVPVPPSRQVALWLFGTGVLDAAANVTFLYATSEGLLSLVSVLTSLYPAATALLARWYLKERLTRLQLAGFAAAMTATVLIAVA